MGKGGGPLWLRGLLWTRKMLSKCVHLRCCNHPYKLYEMNLGSREGEKENKPSWQHIQHAARGQPTPRPAFSEVLACLLPQNHVDPVTRVKFPVTVL